MMNFWKFLKKLFRKKTEDNSFYKVRAEHQQIARDLEEWEKKEIMRTLQAPKSLNELKRGLGAETFQGENYLIQQMMINSRISKQENNTNEIYQQTRSQNYDE